MAARTLAIAAALVGLCLTATDVPAQEGTRIFVAPGGSGSGTSAAPFGRIQDALAAAGPGDVILVRPGEYHESLRTTRDGTAARPIVVRAAEGRGSVTSRRGGAS
jgi:hypothetical protein